MKFFKLFLITSLFMGFASFDPSGQTSINIPFLFQTAEQGDATAQFFLGFMYYEGHGVSQDYEQALHWYKKSAAQGDAEAQLELGWLYYEGLGVAQDRIKALYWYNKAADQGNVRALEALEALGLTMKNTKLIK